MATIEPVDGLSACEELRTIARALGTIEGVRVLEEYADDEEEYEGDTIGAAYPADSAIDAEEEENERTNDTDMFEFVEFPVRDVLLVLLVSFTERTEDSFESAEFVGKLNAETFRMTLGIEAIPTRQVMEKVLSLLRPAVLERMYGLWCACMGFEPETAASIRRVKNLSVIGDGKLYTSSLQGKKALRAPDSWDPSSCLELSQMDAAAADPLKDARAALDMFSLQNMIVDAHAVAPQISDYIVQRGAHYILDVTEDTPAVYELLGMARETPGFLDLIKMSGHHSDAVYEMADHTQRFDYWQTTAPEEFPGRGEWQGLQTVAFMRHIETIGDVDTITWRCFLSSLPEDIMSFIGAVCTPWRLNVLHTQFGVADADESEETAVQTVTRNLAVLRKWRTTLLRQIRIDGYDNPSFRMRSYVVSWDPQPVLDMLACMV